jgi:ATP-dependent DNA helicase RecG
LKSLELISQGENAFIEFKSSMISTDSLAKEMVAFLNSNGGHILIGVEDDARISGIDKSEKDWETWVANIARNHINPPLSNYKFTYEVIEDKTIILINLDKGRSKPYQTNKNHFLVRVGSTNRVASQAELLRLYQESGVFHYDAVALDKTKFSNIDLNKVSRYFDLFDINFSEENQPNVLKNIDVMDDTGSHLTVAGNLIFGLNPQKYLHEASITFARFKGTEITSELIDKKVIEGTLDVQVDLCLSTIKANLLYSSEIIGTKALDTHKNISDKVLREIIVNACVHRDYSILGSRIRVLMFDNRIEVRSPGRLPNTVNIEKIKHGVSYARNPIIVKFMENLRYIDKMGRGIPMVIKEVLSRKQQINFEEFGEEFIVTISI